jgi:6-phosphogluconolactonase
MSVSHVYVGTFTQKFGWLAGTASDGIERFGFNDDGGSLFHVETVAAISPQYLAVHPTLPVLYAAEFAIPGALTAFSIQPDGALERRLTTGSFGDFAVAVSVHQSGRCAYVANIGSGNFAFFSLDAEGMMSHGESISLPDAGSPPSINESGPSMTGWEGPAPHQIRPNADGSAVLVAFYGRDELVGYRSGDDGTLSAHPDARVKFPSGSKPRHMQFHPSGSFIYVVGESDSMLHVLEAEDGLPTRIVGSYPTAPPGYTGTNINSELELHPDKKSLYVGCRGSDCIAIFGMDDEGRSIETLGHQASLGSGPRGLTIDPTGQYLIVANAGAIGGSDDQSASLVVFRIDHDRSLQQTGFQVGVSAPSKVVFGHSIA